MEKQSKQSISKIQRDIWQQLRRICLKPVSEGGYANPDGSVDCYTCDSKDLQGSNRQLGHLWAKASLGAFLKYDMRILRWQCMRCNQFQGGRGADFYARMLKEIGKHLMKVLERDRQVTVKAIDFYTSLLEYYKTL